MSFKWSEECDRAFVVLKERLTNIPILTHPDFSKSFILDTDASDQSIGVLRSQEIEGKEKIVAYAMSKSERKYCVTRRELLSVIHFIKYEYFRHYFYGRKFFIRTDHSSLKWLLRLKDPDGQLARWLEVVSSYEMEIQHRPGR